MLKKLKNQVEYCLQKSDDTKNSDYQLTLAVWLEFYSKFIDFDPKYGYFIKLRNIKEVPAQDNIVRIRRQFQSSVNKQPQYLPTDPIIRKKRGIKEEEWRGFLGYNKELRQIY